MFRYRIDYAKKDTLRFVGMLDLQKIWERVFRRANIPICYSQGFHPLPKFHMAAPLPLGFEGNHELADVWLEKQVPVADLTSQIIFVAPAGLWINEIYSIDLREPALQTQVQAAVYRCRPLKEIDPHEMDVHMQDLLQRGSIMRMRRNKEYDLKPLITSMTIHEDHPSFNIEMKLLAREGATGRPDEVIAAMDYDPLDFSYCRQKLFLFER